MKFISSTSFLIIAIVLSFVFIKPFYGEVKQSRNDVSSYNKALNNSTELQKTRDSLVEKYKSIKQEDKDRLNRFLPSAVNNIELILEIEKIANLHGMPIGNIRFESKVLEGTNDSSTNSGKTAVTQKKSADSLPYGIFPVEFVVVGDYDTFISFLKDLEHNLRLVDARSITFTTTPVLAKDNSNANLYNFTLKVQTYWLK